MIDIAFDLAASTGVCVRSYSSSEFCAYTWSLQRGDLGGKRSPLPFFRLWKRLHRHFGDSVVRKVIFEDTHGRGAAKFRLDGLQAVLMLWCQIHSIRWMRATPTEWKKAMVGKAHATKAEYLGKALKRFPDLKNDDEAAAYWLMQYMLQMEEEVGR